MLEAQQLKVVEHLAFTHDDALSYKCSESTFEDWLDSPDITPKLIVELQCHAKVVAEHLAVKELLETTSSVREFTEAHINSSDNVIKLFKSQTNTKFKDIFKRHEGLDAYVKSFYKNYIQFCKKYTDDMEVNSL